MSESNQNDVRRTLQGRVVGNKATQTITVLIERKVQQRVLQLSGIGHRRQQVVARPDHDLQGLAQGAEQQLFHMARQLQHVDRSGAQRLPAREGQQPVGQVGPAFRGADDGLRQGVVAPFPVGKQLGIAADDGEDVVEIMGHAAGQLADGIHLL